VQHALDRQRILVPRDIGHPSLLPSRIAATRATEFIAHFAKVSGAPVRTGVNVTSVRQAGEGYRVTTGHGEILARTVVIAKGQLRHDGGVVDRPGQYALGLPVLRRRPRCTAPAPSADRAGLPLPGC
jgi:glycine/D-amino acid oxidase-like deaminating enzyme